MLLAGKYRLAFIFFLIGWLITSCFWITKLSFSFSFEEFFASDDPELVFFHEARSQFDEGDELMTIGITHDRTIFEPDFLRAVSSLEMELQSLEGVDQSLSITSLKNPVKGVIRVKEELFIDVEDTGKMLLDTAKLFQYPDVHPKFVSPDHHSTCLFLTLVDDLPDDFVARIVQLIEAKGFMNYHIYGLNVAQDSYEAHLKSEITWLSLLALLLIILTIYLCYRSFSLLVVVSLFLGTTITLTMGLAYWIGATMNVLTVTIPPIIAIVSMSDLIHVFTRFVEGDLKGKVREKIQLAYRDIGHSLLLTSFTTAIGFFSLVFTGVVPFIHFGLITSLGILLAYLLTILLVPLLIEWFIGQASIYQWSLSSIGLLSNIRRYQGIIVGVSAILLMLSFYFGSLIKVNTYIFDDLDAKDPLSKTLAFFEENFFGIRDLELFVTPQMPYDALDEEVIRELEKLETYLMEVYQAQSVYSLSTQVKRLNRMNYGGVPQQYRVPERSVKLERLLSELRKEKENPLMKALVNGSLDLTRVQVKSMDWGSAITSEKNDELTNYIDHQIDSAVIDVRLSGEPFFLDKSNEQITRHLFFSLLGALVIILIIVGALYRSVRMSLIALVANIFPLVIMLLIMYALDITLKKSTAVVFTIAFGIAVDDTIHFLSRLHLEMKRGLPLAKALEKTLLSTGKAILITSLLLVGGFGSFAFSSFQSTFLTGTLISAALLMALLADLILLPALVGLFYAKE